MDDINNQIAKWAAAGIFSSDDMTLLASIGYKPVNADIRKEWRVPTEIIAAHDPVEAAQRVSPKKPVVVIDLTLQGRPGPRVIDLTAPEENLAGEKRSSSGSGTPSPKRRRTEATRRPLAQRAVLEPSQTLMTAARPGLRGIDLTAPEENLIGQPQVNPLPAQSATKQIVRKRDNRETKSKKLMLKYGFWQSYKMASQNRQGSTFKYFQCDALANWTTEEGRGFSREEKQVIMQWWRDGSQVEKFVDALMVWRNESGMISSQIESSVCKDATLMQAMSKTYTRVRNDLGKWGIDDVILSTISPENFERLEYRERYLAQLVCYIWMLKTGLCYAGRRNNLKNISYILQDLSAADFMSQVHASVLTHFSVKATHLYTRWSHWWNSMREEIELLISEFPQDPTALWTQHQSKQVQQLLSLTPDISAVAADNARATQMGPSEDSHEELPLLSAAGIQAITAAAAGFTAPLQDATLTQALPLSPTTRAIQELLQQDSDLSDTESDTDGGELL